MSRVIEDQQLGTGVSTAEDAAAAAAESIGAALAGRSAAPEDLVLVFPDVRYDPQDFLAAAQEAAGAAQVVGCTSFSGIAPEGHVASGAVAVYLPAGELVFGIAAVDDISADIFTAAATAADRARERAGGEGDCSLLLVLTDGLAGDQREVVRGSYSVTGAMVSLVGAAAGESGAMSATHQFGEGRVMANGLVAVWINSPTPLGIGVEHGWHPIGEPMIVTRAEANVIHQLDGRTAIDAYLAHRGSDLLTGVASGQEDATFAGATFDRPLGLANASGRFDARHILGRTDTGSIVMFGHVSEQSVVQVLAGDWHDLLSAAARAAASAVEQLGRPSRGALVFSCAGRVPALQDHLAAEAAAVNDALPGVAAAGFYTYGEFARVTGSTGFHNATVVVLAF